MNFKGFIDTTLRDGAASPILYDTHKYFFNLDEKKRILEALISLGVENFEFFSPVVSKQEMEDFCEIKKYIKTITTKKIRLLAHCRCHPDDISSALEAGFDGLNLYMGLSDHALENSYKKSREEVNKLIVGIIRKTRKEFPDIYLRYSGEDAFRTSMDDIIQVYDQIYECVDTFGFPDTTGVATPELVREKIKILKNRYPEVNLECHFHNDRGLALINAISAIQGGAEYIQTTIWGIAERSGIPSITALLLNLYAINSSFVDQYSIELSYPVNVLMASILGWHVPWSEPVSLTNRTHIAGVHQKAVLNSAKNYEAHNLENFGVNNEQLLLGPLSGFNFIRYYLNEVKNYRITKTQAKRITEVFKLRVRGMNDNESAHELLETIAKEMGLKEKKMPCEYKNIRVENLDAI
jgi:homocitrate synthase